MLDVDPVTPTLVVRETGDREVTRVVHDPEPQVTGTVRRAAG